ncbi:MAG: hypothetical protein CVU05_15545 [Bacteroidetes bacterium HGW-Bacteroidetes-21]|nr:MAG: hypothetical protein CVU05_15545 [Bacteroidetes bacterium HGW-Bacteroidetes-21]
MILGSCKKDEETTTPTPTVTPYQITSADIPVAGEQYRLAVYTVTPNDTFTVGASGQGRVWNYNPIPITAQVDTFDFGSPANHPDGAFFTGSNLYLDSHQEAVMFMDKNSSKVDVTGIWVNANGEIMKGNMTDNYTVLKFPITYNAAYNDTGYASIATTINYQGVDLPGKYDIKFKVTSLCNAEGNITTPTGTYKCIRDKRREIQDMKVSVQVLGQWSEVYSQVDTNYTYTFWSKDKKWYVADVKTDVTDKIISISYLLE